MFKQAAGRRCVYRCDAMRRGDDAMMNEDDVAHQTKLYNSRFLIFYTYAYLNGGYYEHKFKSIYSSHKRDFLPLAGTIFFLK